MVAEIRDIQLRFEDDPSVRTLGIFLNQNIQTLKYNPIVMLNMNRKGLAYQS